MMAAVVIHYSQLIVCLVLILYPENVRLVLNLAVFSYGRIVPGLLLFVQFTITPSV